MIAIRNELPYDDRMEARSTGKRRLQAAGYRYVAGWLPFEVADQVEKLLREHQRRVECVKAGARPRGNPDWRKGD